MKIDDQLLEECRKLSGLTKTANIVAKALKVFHEHESAKRLMLLGGRSSKLRVPPRRRPVRK